MMRLREDEPDLLNRVRSGDGAAWAILQRRYAWVVESRVARRGVRSRFKGAEDIIAEVWASAWHYVRRGLFDPAKSSLATWLARVTANALYIGPGDRSRNHRRRPEPEYETVEADEVAVEMTPEDIAERKRILLEASARTPWIDAELRRVAEAA